MNDINLAPWRAQKMKQKRQQQICLVAIVACMGLCVSAALAGYVYQLNKKRDRAVTVLKTNVRRYDASIAKVKQLYFEKQQLLSLREKLQRSRKSLNKVLCIYSHLATDTEISPLSLDIDTSSWEVAGLSGGYASITRFMEHLRKTCDFPKVAIHQIKQSAHHDVYAQLFSIKGVMS